MRADWKGVLQTPSVWIRFAPYLFLGILVIGALIGQETVKAEMRAMTNEAETSQGEMRHWLNEFNEDKKRMAEDFAQLSQDADATFANITQHMERSIEEVKVQVVGFLEQGSATIDVLEQKLAAAQTDMEATVAAVEARMQGVIHNTTEVTEQLQREAEASIADLEQQVVKLQGTDVLVNAIATYEQTIALQQAVNDFVVTSTADIANMVQGIEEFNQTVLPGLFETVNNLTTDTQAPVLDGWNEILLGGYIPVGYYRNGNTVFLQGLVSRPTSDDATFPIIFTLPQELRPVERVVFNQLAHTSSADPDYFYSSCRTDVLTNGEVRVFAHGSGCQPSALKWLSLSGIYFRVTNNS